MTIYSRVIFPRKSSGVILLLILIWVHNTDVVNKQEKKETHPDQQEALDEGAGTLVMKRDVDVAHHHLVCVWFECTRWTVSRGWAVLDGQLLCSLESAGRQRRRRLHQISALIASSWELSDWRHHRSEMPPEGYGYNPGLCSICFFII